MGGGTEVRSLRSAFVEVHEELESKFPDYEAQSKEHSRMAQVLAAAAAAASQTVYLLICCPVCLEQSFIGRLTFVLLLLVLPFNGSFSRCTSVSYLHLLRNVILGIIGMGFLWIGCPSFHRTIGVTALKEHGALILTSGLASSFIHASLMEEELVPRQCQYLLFSLLYSRAISVAL